MVRTLCFFFIPVKFTVTALIQEVNSRGRLEFIFTMKLLLKDQGMSSFFDWKNDRNQSHCGKWRDWNNNSIMKEYNTVNIEYHRHGDYYFPNLTLEDYNPKSIGKYGRMRKRYLKEHRPMLYTHLLAAGTLFLHLAEIDEACEGRIEFLTQQMAKQEGVTETLKATDQMEWVRRMNNIRNLAEEIVLHELIYC